MAISAGFAFLKFMWHGDYSLQKYPRHHFGFLKPTYSLATIGAWDIPIKNFK
jgi:hypothetical protein